MLLTKKVFINLPKVINYIIFELFFTKLNYLLTYLHNFTDPNWVGRLLHLKISSKNYGKGTQKNIVYKEVYINLPKINFFRLYYFLFIINKVTFSINKNVLTIYLR